MLKLEHISFTADDKEILKDINLTLDDHFIAITGPNGSGKSTLLKVIMGIITPEGPNGSGKSTLLKVIMGIITPDTGRILLDGEDITDLSITERARKGISFAFQQPVRFKGLRVRDLLELAAGRKKGKEGTEAFYQACRTLNAVGLDAKEYIGRELNDTLSGGEMKRIEIAMAAARGTALTLFDEPEAGIDLWSFQSLIQVFEKRILNIADKIIYLKDGEVLEYDEGRKVMQHLAEDIQPVPDMGAAAQ